MIFIGTVLSQCPTIAEAVGPIGFGPPVGLSTAIVANTLSWFGGTMKKNYDFTVMMYDDVHNATRAVIETATVESIKLVKISYACAITMLIVLVYIFCQKKFWTLKPVWKKKPKQALADSGYNPEANLPALASSGAPGLSLEQKISPMYQKSWPTIDYLKKGYIAVHVANWAESIEIASKPGGVVFVENNTPGWYEDGVLHLEVAQQARFVFLVEAQTKYPSKQAKSGSTKRYTVKIHDVIGEPVDGQPANAQLRYVCTCIGYRKLRS